MVRTFGGDAQRGLLTVLESEAQLRVARQFLAVDTRQAYSMYLLVSGLLDWGWE
jgi:hypothetical protein